MGDAGGDAISRGDLQKLARAVDLHTHAATRGAGVRRLHTTSAPTTTGEVQITGDDVKWWGASAGAVRTGVHVEGAQTISGAKTYAAATTHSAGLATGAAKVYINDTSDANVTVGLVVNQGANDDKAATFKSSDVAHGMTDLVETDTYLSVAKNDAAGGGAVLNGYDDGGGVAYGALTLIGTLGQAAQTTKATTAFGVVRLAAQVKSGATGTTVGANGNLLSVDSSGTTRFILDADGDSHQDVGTAWTNFDAHDDVALLTTLAHHVARPGNAIRAEFGKWLTYHRDALEAAGLVTFNDGDGHHFVNMSRLTMLLVGAVRQQAAKVAAVEERLAGWERRLLALEAR